MTPKEKAKELVDKCKIEIYNEVPALQSNIFHLCIFKSAKQCALIAVDEIINILDQEGYDEGDGKMIYYLQVKQEIE